MGTLQLQNISLAFGDRDILDNVSFTLDTTTRAALAGGNGCGKSTLLKVIAHIMPSDSMTVSATKGLRVSYLPQSDIVPEKDTVYEEVERGYSRFVPMLERKSEIESQLTLATAGSDHEYLLQELNEINDSLLDSDYFNRKGKIEAILMGLGFSASDFTRNCMEFSGGYQMRIALAKILVERPDIMLLDEPTNYLDIEARIYLKNYLRGFRGGVMLVSHDQGFLDETVNEVYELFNGKLTRYAGNYTKYVKVREEEIKRLEEQYRAQQAEIEKTEKFIEAFRYKATKAKQVQSRIKMLEKTELIEVPSHLKKMSITFPPAPHSGNDVVKISNLHKAWGDNVIYDDFDLFVQKGDRLAVTGRNGEGKTTLLRMIAGMDSMYSGTIELGAGVKIGYYAQDNEKTLNDSNEIIQEITEVADTNDIPKLRNYLGAFLFSGDDVFKKISVLSGGERSRVALLKILLHPVNLLILDEPTNHLDINSKDMLLDALERYDGTIIFVSHDSYFIEKLATRILYLSEDRPQMFDGDYQWFISRIEEKQNIDAASGTAAKSAPTAASLDYRASREKSNRKKKVEREIENLEKQMDDLSEEIGRLEEEMALPENYSVAEKINSIIKKKEACEEKLSGIEEKWFEFSEELAALREELGL